MGARGFIVTFRQIDPLFTIDLSDPYGWMLVTVWMDVSDRMDGCW